MSKGIECEVLTIPVGELLPSDEIAIKGMCFTVWSIERLDDKPADSFGNPAGYLMRIHGEVANYQSCLILDSRFVLTAVIRALPEQSND